MVVKRLTAMIYIVVKQLTAMMHKVASDYGLIRGLMILGYIHLMSLGDCSLFMRNGGTTARIGEAQISSTLNSVRPSWLSM